jgi:hypothetical protein
VSAGWAESVVSVELVAPAEWVVWAASAELAVTVPQLFLPAVLSETMAAATGRTTLNIAAVRHIGTALPQTGLEAMPAVIRSPNAGPALSRELPGKGGVWPAAVLRVPVWATGPAPEVVPSAIAPLVPALAAGRQQEEEPTALVAGTWGGAVAEIGMPSEVVPGDTTDQVRTAAEVVASPVCNHEVAEGPVAEEASVAAVAGAGRRSISQRALLRRSNMKSTCANINLLERICIWGAMVYLSASGLLAAQQSAAKPRPQASAAIPAGTRDFGTPEQAADALVAAADKWDLTILTEIFGPDGNDIVFSGEFAQDRKHAADFAAQAHQKKHIAVDPRSSNRAFLLVGNDDWPFPVPLVKSGQKWFFDSKAGRQELLYRRIGANELDAIEICHGYVEAQYEYATRQRAINDVNQYAQRIVSAPGKQDGLAWQNSDGTWGGPIGANIARAIEQGYTSTAEPYHGYFFRILKGQGSAAPLGEMDFVVKGFMIGGFALVAAPAEYGVTGVRTFIVSHDGVVYEKDVGQRTFDEFTKMERFNPDKSWTPVTEKPE